jgi:hypothetical protein
MAQSWRCVRSRFSKRSDHGQAVGALFTVVSVTLADVVFGKASLTLASLAGSGLIIGGFTVLAHEAFRASH